MPLQVGMSCYASPVEAGRAACSQFSQVASVSGNLVKTVSCSGSDPITGALLLDVVTTDTSSLVTSTVQVSQPVTFAPCVQDDYLVAFEVFAGGVLSVYTIWVCGWKLLSYLGWSRGENA